MQAAIRAELSAELRADGFSGSGRTFRRTKDGLVHLLNIQGSKSGGSFAINLAIQPLGIPDVLGNSPDPQAITEERCEFRRRLAADGTDQWWEHDSSEDSMRLAVRQAAVVYAKVGRNLFARFSESEALMRHATASHLETEALDLAGFGSTKIRMALALGRLRASEGNFSEARVFAQYGLANLGSAVALRGKLERLAENDASHVKR